MAFDLSIGIPTAGRPEALARCIASIRESVTVAHRIIVFDSLPGPATEAICANQPDILYQAVAGPVGPSGSRRAIVDLDDREVLLFLDDDIVVRPGAVEMLLDHLEQRPEVDIAAGGWEEAGRLDRRALAQWLVFGETPAGRVVTRRYLTLAEARAMGLTTVRADGVLATMAVRRRVWSKVGFDPRFGFFYEMLDLFLQCREAGLVIHALPGSVFSHAPLTYSANTTRQTSPKVDDERRFTEKWGLIPVERPGGQGPPRGRARMTGMSPPSLSEPGKGSRWNLLRRG